MIKRHRNRNDYYYAGENLWIRDFTKKHVNSADINNLITLSDMQRMLCNETENAKKMVQRIDTEEFDHPAVVIVNTGHLFKEKQCLLDGLGENVIVMGVNDVLNGWTSRKRINYYVVNNPYENCVNYLPRQQNLWVRCVASKRTNHEFLERYKGLLYQYTPVRDGFYSGLNEPSDYQVDDYRNPICAALGLSYRFKVRKVLLFCCDEGYTTERPGTVATGGGLWSYPQQALAQKLIDGNLYWLAKSGVQVGHYPDVAIYANSKPVPEEGIAAFFN